MRRLPISSTVKTFTLNAVDIPEEGHSINIDVQPNTTLIIHCKDVPAEKFWYFEIHNAICTHHVDPVEYHDPLFYGAESLKPHVAIDDITWFAWNRYIQFSVDTTADTGKTWVQRSFTLVFRAYDDSYSVELIEDEPAKLLLPNEGNKVYCAQFVADELVVNDVEPGYYAFRVSIAGSVSRQLNDMFFKIGEPQCLSTLWYDLDPASYYCLQLKYNINTKTLTITIFDESSDSPAQSPTDYHVDIFKIA